MIKKTDLEMTAVINAELNEACAAFTNQPNTPALRRKMENRIAEVLKSHSVVLPPGMRLRVHPHPTDPTQVVVTVGDDLDHDEPDRDRVRELVEAGIKETLH